MSADGAVALGHALASDAVVGEVTKKVRERGLVVWLDAEGHFTGLMDRLAQEKLDARRFPFPLVRFRHSYLELMLALEPYANDLHAEHVLVHLPGLNKDTVRETPVYELYKAGTLFEKSLPTLIREAARGEARPEEVERYLAVPGASLESADAWLASLRESPRDAFLLRVEALGIEDVVLALFRHDPRLAGELPKEGEKLFEYLQRGLGITKEWREFMGAKELGPAALATLVASWLMAVEFVNDLREAPAMPELRALTKIGGFARECSRLAARARNLEPDTYEVFALDLQRRLTPDREHPATALGSIDTFRFEEAATREAALTALRDADWDRAYAYAVERTPEKCFWVQRASGLQRSWQLIRLAAEVGRAASGERTGLTGCASLEEAVERYQRRLAEVDRRHRIFEQRAHALMPQDLEDYDVLLEVREAVRRAYRTWADATNCAFSELCRAHGALPSPELRQRLVYEQVVHPQVAQGGRVAFFMVDALRFEMAQALGEELKHEKYSVVLQARLAELPTITQVGMNALAPVEKGGRLRLALEGEKIAGLRGSEYAVKAPADRVRAMRERSGTALDFELDEFAGLSVAKLKQRLGVKSGLVVVRSRELDSAGEHGLHLGTFDQTLTLLKSAVSLLQHAGVEHFVIASDHGFLLQDTTTTENVDFGRDKRASDRRHALLAAPSGMPDVLEVPLSSLQYDADGPRYLVFRPDTALWNTKEKIAPFVHGGNSLQERVIPVLVVERSGRRGKTTTKYEIVAKPEPAHLGRQRLKLSVRLQKECSASLSFHAPKAISLALRIPGNRPDVTLALLDATPPAKLANGRILLPPTGEETVVEFELEGVADEKLRVEVFHPDGEEDVTPKIVEGFFDVFRNRRISKPPEGEARPGSEPLAGPGALGQAGPGISGEWQELIADEGYRKVLVYIEQRRSMNEAELEQMLGSARRVRAFSRQFDELSGRIPFTIEIHVVNGLKTYVRKD